MSMLEAINLTHAYGDKTVLDDVNFHAGEGEFIALVGPNGAGKTTFLRALAGLLKTDVGSTRIMGCDPTACGAETLARNMAYLPQNGDVHWPVTVRRLVALGRLPHLDAYHAPGQDDEAAIEQAMELADVMHLGERAANTLSGGERGRVLLARALAVGGRVLLTDEPVAALDPSHQLEVMSILKSQSEDGGTVVVVLHDLLLAQRFADRIVLMDEGRIVGDGDAEQVLNHALIEKVYGVKCVEVVEGAHTYMLPWTLTKS